MRNVVLLFILLPIIASAQYKIQLLPVSLMFSAGAAKGTADFLQYHYTGNNQFLNPDLSWHNKWKNGNPQLGEAFLGSSTIFVCFTDGWHLANTVNKYCCIGTVCVQIGGKKKPFKHYLYDFAVYSLAYSAGFCLTYEIIFKTE